VRSKDQGWGERCRDENRDEIDHARLQRALPTCNSLLRRSFPIVPLSTGIHPIMLVALIGRSTKLAKDLINIIPTTMMTTRRLGGGGNLKVMLHTRPKGRWKEGQTAAWAPFETSCQEGYTPSLMRVIRRQWSTRREILSHLYPWKTRPCISRHPLTDACSPTREWTC